MGREHIADIAEILLEYFDNNKTLQTDKVITVPAENYTNLDQWRAEREAIFTRVPLMLALSCELPMPGDYKAMDVVGRPILITRDKTGKVHTFLNVCAHRWAPVAAEGYGNCARFTCPFHGWTYGADGRLIVITDPAKFGEIDRSVHGLKELPCEERHGMIFGGLTPGTPLDLDGYYGELLEEYAHVGLRDWTFVGSRIIEGANWKITLNNFFETYHFAALHAKTVAADTISDMTHYEGFGPNMRISLSWRTIGKLRDVPRTQWSEQEGQCFSFIRFFFPNVTGHYLAPEFGLSLFTQTFPGTTPGKSRTVLLYARKDPPTDESHRENIEKEIKYVTFDITYDEDLAIGIQIQRALESQAHDGLLYGQNESGNQYFQKWVTWYLDGNPNQPKPVM